jgi:DNA repair exonuclease SbcCD nuclease subunit
LALARETDAVLISGDLFDNDRLSFETQRFLVRQLERLREKGIPVFYAAGNHDPGRFTETLRIPWPDNVHVFDDGQIHTVPVTDAEGALRANITACGHRTKQESENFAAMFPKSDGSTLHIGLLHTQVFGSNSAASHGRYAPCSLADLEERGYDYWALGHIHLRQAVDTAGMVQYPGCIQGRDPGETGLKGCLWVELLPHTPPQATFVPLSDVVWHWLRIDDLEGIADLEALTALLQEKCLDQMQAQETSVRRHLFRLELAGPCPMARRLQAEGDTRHLEEALKEALQVLSVELWTEGVTPPLEIETFQEGTHVLALALQWIEKARQDPAFLKTFAPERLAAGNMEEEETLRYLNDLLIDLDLEAVHRMAGDDK